MSKLKKCPRCSRDVFKGTKKCPHCGYKFADYEKLGFPFVMGLLFMMIGVKISGSDLHSRDVATQIMFVIGIGCLIATFFIFLKENEKG